MEDSSDDKVKRSKEEILCICFLVRCVIYVLSYLSIIILLLKLAISAILP